MGYVPWSHLGGLVLQNSKIAAKYVPQIFSVYLQDDKDFAAGDMRTGGSVFQACD
jgi:hypothetical protein